MAKKSAIARQKKRERLIAKYAERRAELRKTIKDPKTPPAMRDMAVRQLNKLPRNSCPTRSRNRCGLTGRPRGYMRKFGMSRISFRELALDGMLPGVTKASW